MGVFPVANLVIPGCQDELHLPIGLSGINWLSWRRSPEKENIEGHFTDPFRGLNTRLRFQVA